MINALSGRLWAAGKGTDHETLRVAELGTAGELSLSAPPY